MKASVMDKQSTRYILIVLLILALAVIFFMMLPKPVNASNVPPPMPADLQVPAGNRLFLVGHARGTQDYICLPSGTGVAWSFLRPQATLFDDENEQLTTHFLSINPSDGLARATWQDSRDTSVVWAVAVATSSDPAYVAPGAIPWLKLQRVHSENGPDGGDRLTATTFIQRLNTAGGVAPRPAVPRRVMLGKGHSCPTRLNTTFTSRRATKSLILSMKGQSGLPFCPFCLSPIPLVHNLSS